MKYGKWIEEETLIEKRKAKCSECRRVVYMMEEYSYCPYCGASMNDNPEVYGEWIPAKEKLPKSNGEVLYVFEDEVCHGNYQKGVGVYDLNFWFEGLEKDDASSLPLRREEDIVAWMPLPEPYREGQKGWETDKEPMGFRRVLATVGNSVEIVFFASGCSNRPVKAWCELPKTYEEQTR